MDRKYLYVLISQTGTWTSKVIQKTTKSKYCHASISLEEDLRDMYSFGRRVPWTPFFGGFIHETPTSGVFQRYPKTEVAVLRFEITEKQREEIYAHLEEMYLNKRKYKYDYLGAIKAKFHKPRNKKNRSHCAKFSQRILEQFKVVEKGALPTVAIPQDFVNTFRDNVIFEGRLQDYCKAFCDGGETTAREE